MSGRIRHPPLWLRLLWLLARCGRCRGEGFVYELFPGNIPRQVECPRCEQTGEGAFSPLVSAAWRVLG